MPEHVVCPHCLAVNRLREERAGEKPRCGQCHRELFDGPVELTAATFETHLTRNDIPLVVDFWAPWCGPCKMMAPHFAQAAAALAPGIRLAKVDTDAQPELGARFGIRSIPTLALFHRGREVARQSGALSAGDIERWVRSNLR